VRGTRRTKRGAKERGRRGREGIRKERRVNKRK
jgi:hypothetical protein